MLEYAYQLKGFDQETFTKHMKKSMKKIFSKWTLCKKLLKAIIYTRRPREGIGAYVVNSTFGELWNKNFSVMEARFRNEGR